MSIRSITTLSVYLFIALFLLSFPLFATSQPPVSIPVASDFKNISVGPYLQYWKDDTAKRTLEFVNSSQLPWIDLNSNTLNHTYTDAAFWSRFQVNNLGDETRRLFFISEFPLIESAQLSWKDEKTGDWVSMEVDRQKRFRDRYVENELFVFPIEVPPLTERMYYVRVFSRMDMVLSFELADRTSYLDTAVREGSFHTFFYGMILVIVVYNAFLYLSLKDRSYLYYCLYGITFLLYQMAYFGHGTRYLWGDWVWFENRAIPILMSVNIGVFGMTFFREFLFLKSRHPKLDQVAKGITLISFLLFFASLYFDPAIMVQFFPPFAIINILFLGGTGFYAYSKGLKSAGYVLAAFSLLFAVGIVAALRSMGIVPYNDFTMYGIQLGSASEMVLLSFGLAHRIRILRGQKETAEMESEARRKFVTQMSHEIRTPLSAIIASSALLSQTKLNTDQTDLVEILARTSQNLKSLLDNVLDLSKIQSGKMGLNHDPIDIHAIVNEMANNFQADAKIRGLSILVVEIENTNRLILGDEVRIKQILGNLIGNALKFTNKGTIRILQEEAVDKGKDYWKISIEDTGVGFSPEVAEKLFQSYEQNSENTIVSSQGTGLGLAISRELAEMMGGRITVISQPGKGSTFTLWLPLQFAEQPESQNKNTNGLESDIHYGSISVLVAEDDRDNRVLLSKMLDRLGITSVCVENGRRALEEFQRGKFDVIILDMEMPYLSGPQVVQEIRRQQSLKAKIPYLVALTAHTGREERELCIQAGFDAFLSKPLLPSDLKKVIYQSG